MLNNTHYQDVFALASQRICEQILREGENLGRGILKVNSFVNHRVDVGLMDLCGHGAYGWMCVSHRPYINSPLYPPTNPTISINSVDCSQAISTSGLLSSHTQCA